jgi:hypothetical protein
MPVETIGEFGTEGAESEWLEAQGELAIRYLKEYCGEPPEEMELEVGWQEHDLGSYPTICLTWEDGMRGAPWKYIARCEAALEAWEDGKPCAASSLKTAASDDEDEEEFEENYFDSEAPPPEPPDDTNFQELHAYLCKANLWAAGAVVRAKPGPKLVDSDEDLEQPDLNQEGR